MNEVIAEIAPGQVAAYMLVLARVIPLFLFAPLFSAKMIPRRAKGIAAVAIALGMAPLAARGVEVPLDVATLGGLLFKELMVGLAFAFSVGALFHAVAIAGSLLDTFIGFSFGAVVDPVTGVSSAVLSQLYTMVAVMVFIAIGGDAWLIRGLAETYELVPLLDAPAIHSVAGGVMKAFSSIFIAALAISAPVVLALVVTDAAIGVVSRVVPQMNVFAVSFPAKVMVGLLMITASLPFAADWIGTELQRSVASAMDAVRVS